ncbi:MAG TPA: thermonuclease family protein [Phycisphaerae bacterium]|nr:thermonuclease family protein [Phycisphaerae bacterium]HRW53454.1 thermonuclease family protein [Phycisphaerae bacterium]
MRKRAIFLKSVALVMGVGAGLAMAETIIGTTSGKVYHNHPDTCGSAKRIQPDNTRRFASKEEAEREGRRQCRTCARLDEKAKEDPPEDAPTKRRSSSGEVGATRVAPPSAGPVRVVSDPSAEAPTRLPQFAHATRVLDGGTIELDVGDKVCLLGIVTPLRNQPAARDALRFIREQTQGRLLRLTMFSFVGRGADRDALGRWIASVEPEGGRDLAGELLFNGYAWLDRGAASARSDEYARLEEAAWSAHRGVWRALSGPDGERIVVTGRGATEYHDQKCEHVPHLTDPLKLKVNEARSRRLAPCRRYRAKGTEKTGQD